MSIFCFQKSQSDRVSKLSLTVGEETLPLMWKGEKPDDNVHAVLFHHSSGLVFLEETRSSAGPQGSYRVFVLTGRTPGSGRFEAIEVPRTGALKTLGQIDIDVRDPSDQDADLVYTGKFIYWRKSMPVSLKGTNPLLYAATSGLIGNQIGSLQSSKDHGPLPEGLYSFFTHLDPRQSSLDAANKRGDKAISNQEEGIQFLPIGGNGPVYPDWGTFRVRLTPVQGNMFGRGGFYLHNSHKGYSHGCIEVGADAGGLDFFTSLLTYAGSQPRKAKLVLRVKYSYPEQFTAGRTLR
ncbi:hypothetical protein GCM10022419_129010 [Nonomuraea rosea]|uniref:DUF2778 domain-containing protein n=1 Tax=Nonomuraea rosea TaxID=638574 RepID=A0ABP6ZWK7_9ACTN